MFIPLGNALELVIRTRNGSNVLTSPDAAPLYRVYDSGGLLLKGSMTLKDTSTISGAADNGSGLIRITTSAAHGLQVGDRIFISGVVGTTEANGSWTVDAVPTTTTLDLTGSTFTNAYVSGGTLSVLGLYKASITCSAGNGFASGEKYDVAYSWLITSAFGKEEAFMVV